MSTVDTTYGTYLSNLFNPQVVADLIDTKLIDNIVFAPLARIDSTLEGKAGNTVTLPYYSYIGIAQSVAEGTDIPIRQLTQSTKQVTIVKYGIATQLTDEAVLSNYGDPVGEAAMQITTSIADALDTRLLEELNTNTTNVYKLATTLSADDIPLALAKFGEDNDGQKVLIVDTNIYSQLLKSDWIPASQIAAEVKIRGTVGMAYGCQVMVSNRVANGNFHIVKPGALAIFMKRNTMLEMDRDILNQSTVIAGSKLFAPYLLDATKAIKIVYGVDDGLKKLTIESAAGTDVGDTALTVSGYTLGANDSYKYKVGDAVTPVALGDTLSDWTSWNGTDDITAATGKTLTLAVVNSTNGAVAGGSVTVTAKAS